MTPEEKFLFDLNGYLIVKNVLDRKLLSHLQETALEKWKQHGGGNKWTGGPVTLWNDAYRNLMDHSTLLPYLITLIDAKFRIDHDYCIFMSEGAPGMDLHGGEGHEGDHWYRYKDGEMKNGLTVAVYCLSDAKEGDGGFVCIPGSHKSNFPENIPANVMKQKESADYVIQPAVAAGDVILFTEALVHGTRKWTAAHQRMALFYKYSPGYSAWAQEGYCAADYPGATARQQRLMSRPSVGGRPDVL